MAINLSLRVLTLHLPEGDQDRLKHVSKSKCK